MKNTVTTEIRDVIEPLDLMDYTTPRLSQRQHRSNLRACRNDLHAALRSARRYAGGLPAETQSAKSLTAATVKSSRQAARKSWANLNGREIDLKTLMAQRHKDGSPVWAIVDPTRPISWENGGRDSSGDPRIGQVYDAYLRSESKNYTPSGLPVLPAKARKLLLDKKIRQRAYWVGVLYQPQEWTKINPDPAVVVKWKATEKYAALAVWGGDYHRIMEFVH